jgi:hypothetical protein
MKTMIELDDEALELTSKELGTTTKQDTVNAALEFIATRAPACPPAGAVTDAVAPGALSPPCSRGGAAARA